MASIEHCVTDYEIGYVKLKVSFPNRIVTCDFCPGCNTTNPRVYKCMWLGGQAFASADAKYGILCNCPIKFKQKEE